MEGEYRYRKDPTKTTDFFRSVVFDEIMSLDATSRGLLQRLVTRFREMENGPRVFATGDADQLVIENNLNPNVDITAYLNEWARDVFPTAVILHQPKRFPLAKDKEFVLGLKGALKADRKAVIFDKIFKDKWVNASQIPYGAKVISYTNETRLKVNNVIHYRDHTLPYEVGGTLVYRNRTRKQGNETLYTNYWYTIKAVSDESIVIEEEDEPDITFTLKRETVDNWFTYTHASTVHSAQGSTYKDPVVIADVFHPYVTDKWLYVALTRSTHPRKNVYFLKGRTPSAVDVSAIRQQIEGHLANDEELGRGVGEPISLDWVLERDAMQGGICALCDEPYEMLRVGVKATTSSASVDRIGHRGHEVGNCQILCRSCNFSKKAQLV